jgi:hypothetical protein
MTTAVHLRTKGEQFHRVNQQQMNQRDNAACLESLQAFVDQAMIPLALEGFQSMYKQGEELRRVQSAETLSTEDIMKQLLDEVRTWTQVLLEEEVRRIESRIPYLQKLLTALFVMKVKVLSCINMRKVATEFPLTIPSNHTFVHNMYIHAARALLDNMELVQDMRMANMREPLSDAIRRAEFDCLRWDELLAWGLDGVDPSDALRNMMTSQEVDDTSTEPDTSAPPQTSEQDDDDLGNIANEDKVETGGDDVEPASETPEFAPLDRSDDDIETRRITSEGEEGEEGEQPAEDISGSSNEAAASDSDGENSNDNEPKKSFW